MPKKAQNPPVKKVIVTTAYITELKPLQKPGFAHDVAGKCLNSAVCQASTPCKNMLASWLTSADALDVNQKAQATARNTLVLLQSQEPALIVTYDTNANAFASTVQTVTQGDVAIATGMGMAVRASPTPAPTDIGVPAKVSISPLKKNGAPRLVWEAVPGAILYLAQLSMEPATNATWETLFGRGKTRHLPPLVPGQHYLLRVAAIGRNSKQSAWSETVSIIGRV